MDFITTLWTNIVDNLNLNIETDESNSGSQSELHPPPPVAINPRQKNGGDKTPIGWSKKESNNVSSRGRRKKSMTESLVTPAFVSKSQKTPDIKIRDNQINNSIQNLDSPCLETTVFSSPSDISAFTALSARPRKIKDYEVELSTQFSSVTNLWVSPKVQNRESPCPHEYDRAGNEMHYGVAENAKLINGNLNCEKITETKELVVQSSERCSESHLGEPSIDSNYAIIPETRSIDEEETQLPFAGCDTQDNLFSNPQLQRPKTRRDNYDYEEQNPLRPRTQTGMQQIKKENIKHPEIEYFQKLMYLASDDSSSVKEVPRKLRKDANIQYKTKQEIKSAKMYHEMPVDKELIPTEFLNTEEQFEASNELNFSSPTEIAENEIKLSSKKIAKTSRRKYKSRGPRSNRTGRESSSDSSSDEVVTPKCIVRNRRRKAPKLAKYDFSSLKISNLPYKTKRSDLERFLPEAVSITNPIEEIDESGHITLYSFVLFANREEAREVYERYAPHNGSENGLIVEYRQYT